MSNGLKFYRTPKDQRECESSSTFTGSTGVSAHLDADDFKSHKMQRGLQSLAKQILSQATGNDIAGIEFHGVSFTYILKPDSLERC